MPKLGVNIDHIATVRQARGGIEPDPVLAAKICEAAGCHSIVAHLREDRRHMQDADFHILRKTVRTRLNMEMSIADEVVKVALDINPDQATLVPEKRMELTTEGGLDCIKFGKKIARIKDILENQGIIVSLFVDPHPLQIKAAHDIGTEFVELHTGEYSNAGTDKERKDELNRIIKATEYSLGLGMRVNAGHGLNYNNVCDIARIEGIEELNIGHSIISRAVFAGLDGAVKEMLALIR